MIPNKAGIASRQSLYFKLMTINYLKYQKSQIALLSVQDPQEANERLEDLKLSLEDYIKQYELPEMWANELRKCLDA